MNRYNNNSERHIGFHPHFPGCCIQKMIGHAHEEDVEDDTIQMGCIEFCTF